MGWFGAYLVGYKRKTKCTHMREHLGHSSHLAKMDKIIEINGIYSNSPDLKSEMS